LRVREGGHPTSSIVAGATVAAVGDTAEVGVGANVGVLSVIFVDDDPLP
jgi:hypothetical protein